MLLLYIFLSLICVTPVMTRVRLDPMLVVIPCVLLLSPSLTALWSIYISLVPVFLCLAVAQIVWQRHNLNVETIARLGAGLSLGGFVGIQLFAMLVSSHAVLIQLMFGLTCSALILARFKRLDIAQVSTPLQLWSGLILGTIQSLGFSSGKALLQTSPNLKRQADHFALWAFTLVGILIGLLALPPESHLSLQWDPWVTIIGGLAALCGWWLSHRVNVSHFESNVLRWTVVLVCLSIWVHLAIKYFIFTP